MQQGEVDTERDASGFDAAYYGGLLKIAWDVGRLCFHGLINELVLVDLP